MLITLSHEACVTHILPSSLVCIGPPGPFCCKPRVAQIFITVQAERSNFASTFSPLRKTIYQTKKKGKKKNNMDICFVLRVISIFHWSIMCCRLITCSCMGNVNTDVQQSSTYKVAYVSAESQWVGHKKHQWPFSCSRQMSAHTQFGESGKNCDGGAMLCYAMRVRLKIT